MQRALRRTRDKDSIKEANYVESDEDEFTTAAKCSLRITNQVVSAIVDSGVATSIITHKLLKRLGYNITRPSRLIVVTANGAHTRSLGIADNVLITIGQARIMTSFQVLESKDEVLILGNNWL